VIPLIAWLKSKPGKATGVYYVDSTSLRVCNNKRIHNHKTFEDIAQRGKTSMGWFFGFKLHLITNHQGELMDFFITKGNVDDRAPLKQLCKNIKGYLFGDKGYLSKSKQEELESQGIRLITKVKSNMANQGLS
jgi:IS5 family transposase